MDAGHLGINAQVVGCQALARQLALCLAVVKTGSSGRSLQHSLLTGKLVTCITHCIAAHLQCLSPLFWLSKTLLHVRCERHLAPGTAHSRQGCSPLQRPFTKAEAYAGLEKCDTSQRLRACCRSAWRQSLLWQIARHSSNCEFAAQVRPSACSPSLIMVVLMSVSQRSHPTICDIVLQCSKTTDLSHSDLFR